MIKRKNILPLLFFVAACILIVLQLLFSSLLQHYSNRNAEFEGFVLVFSLVALLVICIGFSYAKSLSEEYPDIAGRSTSGIFKDKVAIFIIILFLYQLLALSFVADTDGKAVNSLFFQDSIDSYMDFFGSLYVSQNTDYGYQGGSIYPPICYVIYSVFASLVPSKLFDNPVQRAAAFNIRNSQAGRMALVLFFLIALIGFIVSVLVSRRGKNTYVSLLLGFALITTAPGLFAIERGNIILLSLPTLALFVFGYKSENKILKEIALLSLAFSTVIKITPAIFFLLLLWDKKYKETVRAIVYTAILFFLPFAYFGGFEQIPMLIGNVFSFSSKGSTTGTVVYPNIPHVNTISFSGAFNFISTINTGKFETQPIHNILGYALSVLLLAASFFTKGWRRTLCLSLTLCGMFRSNTPYVLIYILIPLLAFLCEDFSKEKWLDGIYMFLFLCMTVLFPSFYLREVGKMTVYAEYKTTSPLISVVIQNISMLTIAIVLLIDITVRVVLKFISKKRCTRLFKTV